MFDYFLSFIKPVKRVKEGEITIRIRGLLFKSTSMKEIIRQIEQELEYNRKQLYSNMINTGSMMAGTGSRGRMNMGAVFLRNTLKNIQALEAFLHKGT